MKCEECGKECSGKCCSGACRAKMSRRTVKRTVKPAHAQAHGVSARSEYLTDATGNQHKIDWQQRDADKAQLKAWADSEATDVESIRLWRLGWLAGHIAKIRNAVA